MSPESLFSELEVRYLRSQRLARIATVSRQGQVDVAPVGFQFDGVRFFVAGRNNPVTLKYKNVAAGNTHVAVVVDDLASLDPWLARGVKIHGLAEIVERGDRPVLAITPTRVWSWGLDGRPAIENGQFRVRRACSAG